MVPVREGGVVVRLDLPDPKWERAAEGSQEREPRAVRELREEADHAESGAVVERGGPGTLAAPRPCRAQTLMSTCTQSPGRGMT